MEIGEIVSSYTTQYLSQQSLTEDQKNALEEILAKYDPENMTEEERQAMRAEMREAGIPRTAETGQILMDAGFMPKPPEGMAAGGPPPGPPPDEAEEKDTTLLDLINQAKSGEIDEDEFISLLLDYAESGGSINPGNVIDKSV